MKVIDNELIDSVIGKARQSSRLRMNYDFHRILDNNTKPTIFPYNNPYTNPSTYYVYKAYNKIHDYYGINWE